MRQRTAADCIAMPRRILSLVPLLGLLPSACGVCWAQQRFQAMLADGTRVEGRELSDANRPDRPPTLDGKQLGGEGNPLLAVRDVQQRARLGGSWLELTNGDILPCEILGWGGATAADPQPAHWLVLPWRSPLGEPLDRTELRVRAELVYRAVISGGGRSTYAPGTLVFRDGRRVEVRGLRFGDRRVTALSESGLIVAGLSELAEIHPQHPPGSETAGALDDAVFACALGDQQLVRIRTLSGAELTCVRSMMIEFEERRKGKPSLRFVAIRPRWSLDTIAVDAAEIIARDYRRADEVPLSLLTVDSAVQRAGLHHLPWRKNESVTGGPLASGGAIAELGLGTHAHSELAFALPPHAKMFDCLVALDRAAGAGGCVRLKVVRDEARGESLWQSGHLTGSDSAVRVGPLDVSGAKRLVLVTEMAHEGRPQGADPLDVRDQVVWLRPTIEVDVDRLFESRWRLSDWVPELAGWETSENDRTRIRFQPCWNSEERYWSVGLSLQDAREVVLERRARIGAANAFLKIGAAVDGAGEGAYVVSLRAEGAKLGTTMNGPIKTDRRRGDFNSRVWLLGEYAEREVTLGLVITPEDGKRDRRHGLIFNAAWPTPVIANLPPDSRPLVPEIPLDVLKPTHARIGHFERDRYQPGKLTNGQPLAVRDYAFKQGFGAPGGSEITFPLAADYRRFVAVIGLCPHSTDVGPFEILLDGESHWTSEARFGRNTPAAQIDIPLPPGHQSITLKISGDESYGAWAQAGFMRK